MVQDGTDGFVIPPDDTGVLADKLLLVLRDEALRTRLAEAARDSAHVYHPDVVARKTGMSIKQYSTSTLQKNHAGEHVLKERWLNEMQKINANVRTLKERGARVVFIQLPISGNVLNAYDQLYPKAVYWDSIPDLVDVDLIHFDEHTALSGFKCLKVHI